MTAIYTFMYLQLMIQKLVQVNKHTNVNVQRVFTNNMLRKWSSEHDRSLELFLLLILQVNKTIYFPTLTKLINT